MCNDQAIHGDKHFTFSPLPTVHPRSDYHPYSPSFPKGEEMAVTGGGGGQLSIGRGLRVETDDAIGRGWSRKFGELLWSLWGWVMDLMWLEGNEALSEYPWWWWQKDATLPSPNFASSLPSRILHHPMLTALHVAAAFSPCSERGEDR